MEISIVRRLQIHWLHCCGSVPDCGQRVSAKDIVSSHQASGRAEGYSLAWAHIAAMASQASAS
jgi:hypothetical protein